MVDVEFRVSLVCRNGEVALRRAEALPEKPAAGEFYHCIYGGRLSARVQAVRFCFSTQTYFAEAEAVVGDMSRREAVALAEGDGWQVIEEEETGSPAA